MRLVIESDPVLRYYQQQVDQLAIQAEVSRRNLMGEEHPRMRLLLDQIDGYKQKEMQKREELIEDVRSRQIESLEQEKARILNVQGEVQEQLASKENEQRDVDSAIQLLKSLMQDEERIGRQLEQVAMRVR